ncbi:hypothetical protein JXA02_05825 [candidate division KSB1 bacterium]|nr:hypothetical protein [candidate division KSB1 bacterium]RQW07697.1 MAG: hypothetical protein EH222_06710 [candidate division KSB1 bacterium]
MNDTKSKRILGSVIILVGLFALLINTHLLHGVRNLLGGAVLLTGALFFFSLYKNDRSKWWPLLPAALLAVLGVGVIFDSYVANASDFFGAAFMYTLFAIFAFVFARDRADWWAIIPAGACFTIGTVVLVDSLALLDTDLKGVIFFLGLGLTFLYLWSLRAEVRAVGWAIWPAGALLGLAVLIYADQTDWLRDELIFPLLVILVGVIIILNGARKTR